jgi:hypothetical protein
MLGTLILCIIQVKGTSEEREVTAAKPAKAKRKMSAAGRKAISEATKKRWAAKKAAESAPTKKSASKKKGVKKVALKPVAKKKSVKKAAQDVTAAIA